MFRYLLFPWVLFLNLLLSISLWAQVDQPSDDRPNIILIYLDDMGYGDLGITGAIGFQTPHINRLATEGALLTHYYSPQAVCSAARLGLLTGCYPTRLGFSGLLDLKLIRQFKSSSVNKIFIVLRNCILGKYCHYIGNEN